MSYRNLLKKLEALSSELDGEERLSLGEYIARKNLIFSKQHFDPSLPDPESEAGRRYIAEHAMSDEELERRIRARTVEIERRKEGE